MLCCYFDVIKMNFFPLISRITSFSQTKYINARSIHLVYRLQLDQNWREERGLPRNPNSYGPLTDGPDFRYLDGRPTPVGSRLKSRLLKQREHAAKIIQFSKEMDFALELHKQKTNEAENSRKRIIASKLKEKGKPLLMKPKEK
ncbi:hypothetical protein J437_LFUL001850 [Ladona fulva]|uniref:Large ribosomal subunit protein mL52 n=1 Tax=Ladona fulva TaxID=123851 RepID=A0A8K0JTR4_LADFU|nr:hypothetical protein J437_LFUL001850 [Ladona fulva]